MNKQELIQTLKDTYPRELRKNVVKSIQHDEKNNDTDKIYGMVNQIFSYVLKESNWDIADTSANWDSEPLLIMKEAFPKIETTNWYKEQELFISKHIDVQINQ